MIRSYLMRGFWMCIGITCPNTLPKDSVSQLNMMRSINGFTRNIGSSLVFSEFMGVIRGSEQTLNTINGYLDRVAYQNFSHRLQATFASQRDNIYSLFLSYLKHKQGRGDYDAADRFLFSGVAICKFLHLYP